MPHLLYMQFAILSTCKDVPNIPRNCKFYGTVIILIAQ